uniref:Small ribosomal subunit protein uS15c n=1 Tax=Ceratozamia hildae TaxID=171009 RepID=A0A0A6Z6Z7_CERHI|nr:ribosomal protein S15 [Ceratozamia hildae]AFR13776.1 ribosomal protein S15 [Ceratozamia hildae]BAR93518.1 ribosomal protein S15 [Ceratozamia hildae]
MQKNAPIRSSLILEEHKEGSVESQICYLADRILRLTHHLELHRRDHSSQRGLWQIFGKRKRLLVYLSKRDILRYEYLIGQLSIRGLKTR